MRAATVILCAILAGCVSSQPKQNATLPEPGSEADVQAALARYQAAQDTGGDVFMHGLLPESYRSEKDAARENLERAVQAYDIKQAMQRRDTNVRPWRLKIYGGPEHSIYLGCATCLPGDSESIWDLSSVYGSTNCSDCIWNEGGQFGRTNSEFSPWNRSASSPPVLVDEEGQWYGYFNVYRVEFTGAHAETLRQMFHGLWGMTNAGKSPREIQLQLLPAIGTNDELRPARR